ncbi:MAG: PAS domain-containing protein [Methanoregula sp.]
MRQGLDQMVSSLFPALIGTSAIAALLVNAYAISLDITGVLPHLFYIPVILAAYYYTRRGVVFTIGLSVLYCGMLAILQPTQWTILIQGIERCVVFVVIAVVVSYLTILMQQEAEKSSSLSRIVESSNDAIIGKTPEGIITYWNTGAMHLYGYTAPEIIGKPVEILYPPARAAESRRLIEEIMHGRETGPHETEQVTKSGDRIHVVKSVSLIKSPDGNVTGISTIVHDITEQKLLRDEIRKSEERYRAFFTTSRDAVFMTSVEGTWLDFNDAALELFGFSSREELKEKKVREMYADNAERDAHIRKILEIGYTKEYPVKLRRKDGTLIDVVITSVALRDSAGAITSFQGTIRDMTEQLKSVRALQDSEVKFRTLADYTYDWEYWIDPERSIIYTTPSCERITGYSDTEYLKNPDLVNRIIHPEDRAVMTGHLSQFDTYDEQESFDIRILHRNGKIRWINHVCQPVFSADKKFLGRRVSNRDITDRKMVEMSLSLANRKLGMLSSITRHDILNQLMALKAFLELSKEIEKEPVLLGFIEKEEKAADVIQRQIEFTRYYEHIGVNAPEWQNAAETFLSAAAQLPLGSIRLTCTESDIEIYADPLIEKVFYNLIENSLRHGRTVTAISFSSNEQERGMVFTYRDDGAGIDTEIKAHLFQKGFGKHTGLGLFLIREILSITGISIQETGVPGEGVRFEIAVPKGMYRIVGNR